MKTCIAFGLLITLSILSVGQISIGNQQTVRERISMDFDWRFALGHAYDANKDFSNGTGYFSYFAKTGYGDGAAAENFDDRAWRVLDVPHDWCVELPFAANGSHSHGYKAIGRNYPENSVGWYRKHFTIPESDLGEKISIEFDGVFRNSIVWVNGFYLGTELSGYASFAYDITDYLNYGGDNVIAVRVDATMEEGWYYEGAGIVRNVWLSKTSALHVARWGTFVTTDLQDESAIITVRTQIVNESDVTRIFDLSEHIYDDNNQTVALGIKQNLVLKPGEQKEFYSKYQIENPDLWSIQKPVMHKLFTVIGENGSITDDYVTSFGMRTVKFDPDQGFFLNGEPVKILGTCNHQDHAGLGRAIPEALHEYRIQRLQEMGSNAIRTSHDPPDPVFLDVCDRLGMLVMDENRLMGSNQEHLDWLEALIRRDRNHPSVIIWSLGNEEWAIEGNAKGARIAKTMQDYAQRLDSSRAFTAACSGGWDNGIGTVTQVMGFNYIFHGDIDQHHETFPWQAGIGTEESNTIGTRGIYVTNKGAGHLASLDRIAQNIGAEQGWKFYKQRDFLAGLFFWTGFDYRGEPNPCIWPAVSSQFGIIDLCGFPKDIFYYLKSWWDDEPTLHIFPHWNWSGDEGNEKKVIVYSNCEEVELFLNKNSLGKQTMPPDGHLEWKVVYQPGVLMAKGYSNGHITLTTKIETTNEPAILRLESEKLSLNADRQDIAVIGISVRDKKGRIVPVADNDIKFTIEGPGRIIGVGNGNPSSHERDRFAETIIRSAITRLKELPVEDLNSHPETAFGWDDSEWRPAFQSQSDDWHIYIDTLIVVRGGFQLDSLRDDAIVSLFSKSIVEDQSIYINGNLVAEKIERDAPDQAYVLDHSLLKEGWNEYAAVGIRFRLQHQWDSPNTDPGLVQVVYPADHWERKAFNGLAQILVQSTGTEGDIRLIAESAGLKSAEFHLHATRK
jgi:beta-galactosidase